MTIEPAGAGEAAAIAAVRCAAADDLTARFGHGHWSGQATERAVARDMASSRVFVARDRGRVIGTYTLQRKKPWAIDVTYFTPAARVLYLINMAVAPRRQRKGVGRALLIHAAAAAREAGVEAIRLDAYDAPAGAGEFYRRCGYRETGRKAYRGTPLVYFEQVLSASVQSV